MAIKNLYPTADILAERGHWDKATREVVMDRVTNPPEFHHFHGQKQETLKALCARVLPQDHRPPERRVPVAEWIDQNSEREQIGGFTFEDLPINPTAWEWGLEGLDQTAQALFQKDFVNLEKTQQDQVLERIQEGNPPGEIWQKMPAKRWWIYVALRQITGVYYAHPYAWDEIGFGGPAYPRGYAALHDGAAEPWEPREENHYHFGSEEEGE